MEKEFDIWNVVKKEIEYSNLDHNVYFNERDIWWCSLGLNVGVEADGKHENFERPVLIIKKFNNDMFWAVPLTSREKYGKCYFKLRETSEPSWINLSQLKTLSSKRLIRKMGIISTLEHNIILNILIELIL